MIELVVKGVPTAKGRAKTGFAKSKTGKTFMTHFTPEKTRNAEGNFLAQAIYFQRPDKPTLTPVAVEIEFYMPIPLRDSKPARERKLSGQELPAKKPDIDNLAKLVLDALNGVYWHDDNQIVSLSLVKRYSDDPRTVVRIKDAV